MTDQILPASIAFFILLIAVAIAIFWERRDRIN
jgi:hypothetical protein